MAWCIGLYLHCTVELPHKNSNALSQGRIRMDELYAFMFYSDLMQNPLIVPVKVLRGHKPRDNLGKFCESSLVVFMD